MPFDGKESDFVRSVDAVGSVLLKAADIISDRGLCRGGYGHNGGPRCILGAIAEAKGVVIRAHGRNPEILAEIDRVVRVLPPWTISWMWNDEPGRTAAEVAYVLTRAAYL